MKHLQRCKFILPLLSLMELKTYVLTTVDPVEYYKQRFPEWDSRSRGNVLCPFHEDGKPSLALALHNGGAKCHAASCGRSFGNIVHFESERGGFDEKHAVTVLYSEFVRATVDASVVEGYHRQLVKSARVCKELHSECGISQETIEKFQLGWLAETKRVVIPIRDRWGQTINLRLYKMPKHRTKVDDAFKVLNYVEHKGTSAEQKYGANDLFPWDKFVSYTLDKPIFIMPSEKEALLGIQHGLQCITATAGEDAWDQQWNDLLTGYDIAVVAQRDEAGRRGAEKRHRAVSRVSNFSAVIEPPTEHKDFADYIVRDGGQGLHLLARFAALQKETEAESKVGPKVSAEVKPNPECDFPSGTPQLPPVFSEEEVALSDISARPEMLNRVIKTRGIIAAKATNTYTIPWRFKVKIKNDAERFYALPIGRTILSFIKAHDSSITQAVRDCLGNDKAQVQACDYVTATEVEVIPIAAVDHDVQYVTQRCFFIGARIEANVPYELYIVPTNDVRTQETVGIIVQAIPIARSTDISSFTDEDFATLQVFQPDKDSGQTIMEKMLDLAEDVSKHYSKIYNRPDWHLVALLSWLSPIGWMFPFEKETQRGWMNSLAIGDTQTGKSKVIQTLQKLFNTGAIVNAENCTYVGLVGGAVKMGSGQFMLRWGRIPLCDKQLVVIEELSGLSVEEISNMSEVRSSGVARLDKGGLSAETQARTRLIALSNVRPVNKNLAQYLSGVKAVQELIGHGEDIARFDMIITLVDREVSVEVINRVFSNRGIKDAIPEETFQKLCQFVWSLKPEQIKFTTDAYHLVLDETKRLAELYHPAIPIFKGGSGRYKIARVAAAIACMQFSWDGKKIKVYEEHIEAATQFLEMLYTKESFGYAEFSRQMQDRDGIKDTKLLDEALSVALPNARKRSEVAETLIHSSKFTRDELCAVASLQISRADELIGSFIRQRVVRKGDANVWEVTPAGRDWLATHLKDKPLS